MRTFSDRPVSGQRGDGRWRELRRWLQPGLGVKRWLGLLIIGTTLIGLGLAILLLDVYRMYPTSPWLAFLSLRILPRWLRALVFGGMGVTFAVVGVMRLNRTLLAPYLRPGKSVVDVVANHRRLGRGPRIVAIGGGTGLSTLLRGLKHQTGNLTAIVTMADDGGSSGRLRRSLGLPPPGDLRNCLAALSDDEDLLTRLFQYRFREGEELDGHSFGNLFIAALAGATGSFDRGILEAGRVLAVRGRVLPATLKDIALIAEKTDAFETQSIQVEGESRIPSAPGRIRRIRLMPENAPAYPEAIHEILNADMIVIGPGSLYTSIIPNLLIPDIVAAIRTSRAFRVYVCNVATQDGETDSYTCAQHLEAIEEHAQARLIDLVVANDHIHHPLPEGVILVPPPLGNLPTAPVYSTDLVDAEQPWRHDPHKLGDTLLSLLEERTGPLELPPQLVEEEPNGLV